MNRVPSLPTPLPPKRIPGGSLVLTARSLLALGALLCATAVPADDSFPLVPDDIEVSLFARDPLVRNPCALTFDARGRLFVSTGPQYRRPTPATPGDSVVLLLDDDSDGRADRAKTFATGFNSVQGLAWIGRDLWIANAPDLTVVRDLDGDDQADEYVRVYTDLGNLEHGIHGLNAGPDGKLYFSKGNSKGLTQPPDRLAPRPFRELWGVDRPDLPEAPAPRSFRPDQYPRTYHDPDDDWGREGGILRCDPDGSHLEIVARGFRNPWDIAYDDHFQWLGTDNDQTGGDKIFAPFFGAHFGWGHPWSFHWSGEGHLPTVPASGPLFEGSGTGVAFWNAPHLPDHLRGVFLINDWLRRETLVFRPAWNGAHLVPEHPTLPILAHAGSGRTMEQSHGRSFDPVDLEVGPDDAIYLTSWGRDYGARYQQGEWVNEGRIYRLQHRAAPSKRPLPARSSSSPSPPRDLSDLIQDLDSPIAARRVEAQNTLLNANARTALESRIHSIPESSPRLATWLDWTLGRLPDPDLTSTFAARALDPAVPLERRIQAIRILSHRGPLPDACLPLLRDPQPRVRWESLIALRHHPRAPWTAALIDCLAAETDRVAYYAGWNALRSLLPISALSELTRDSRPGVRLAAVLGLLEGDALDLPSLHLLATDSDPRIAHWTQRRIAGKADAIIRGQPLLQRPSASPSTRVAMAQVPTPTQGLPNATPAPIPKPEQIIDLLPISNSTRGRDLFHSQQGAGCSACHRLEGMGHVFAPDLADIGQRAQPLVIARSILDPSFEITEGFARQDIHTRDGEILSGIILEETGASLTLVTGLGQTVGIPTPWIVRRQSSALSAMPGNFHEILQPLQIADLVAYLLLQTNAASTTPPQPTEVPPARKPSRLSFQHHDGRLIVHLDGRVGAEYLYRHPQLTRPAFVNLTTTSGRPVTRPFPAPADSDHRWMHPGLALSFGSLAGHDFWRLKARVQHVAFTEDPAVDAAGVLRFATRNHLLSTNGTSVLCEEMARYELRLGPDGFQISWDSTFRSDREAFALESQEEAGLALRLPSHLTVRNGSGSILNDQGRLDEAGTWGREFRWIDASGLADRWRVGALIVPHPDNPRTCWAHSRDYGVIVANPLPPPPSQRGVTPVQTWVARGQDYRLRFSVLFYEHPEP